MASMRDRLAGEPGLLIVPEFDAALDAEEYAALPAYADYLTEHGRPVEGDALAWAVAKRRFYSGWSSEASGVGPPAAVLPAGLYDLVQAETRGGETEQFYAGAYLRLRAAWARATADLRADWWAWEPPGGRLAVPGPAR